MIARPSDLMPALFDRGDLPERIQLLRDVPRHNLRRGDVFTWSAARRAYVCDRNLVCVLAGAVRQRFFEDFNHAPPLVVQQSLVFA
jgi:hypothetical protein